MSCCNNHNALFQYRPTLLYMPTADGRVMCCSLLTTKGSDLDLLYLLLPIGLCCLTIMLIPTSRGECSIEN